MSYTPRSSFPLALPPADLAVPPPVYRRPTLITTYSHLPDRSISHDDSSMAYYSPAPIGSDLNYGFERRIERDESIDEHLDGLCEALREVEERGGQAERRGGIITWRGMVTRIMTAPFEDREGWEMTAIPLDGSVYLEQYDPPEVKAKRKRSQGDYARQTYMGYSYESFSTIPTEGVEPRDDDPDGWSGDVNTNVQWCNVVRSAIGEYPLCLGGEVDCVEAEVGADHPGLHKCMELKTNKVIENERQEAIFHKKLLKHWAQSWLLGVPAVEVGFRTEAGIVRSQRRFDTEAIPAFIASTSRPQWSPEPCLHFLHATIQHILFHVLPTDPTPENGLSEDERPPPAAVWRLRFVPRRGIELFRLDHHDEVYGRWGGALPEEYVRWRMSRR